MGRLRAAVLLLMTFCMSGLLYAQDSPWKFRQNQDGIPVYTRKVAGSSVLEYKADVIINAPMSRVVAFFEDGKQIQRWYYQCVYSKMVEKYADQKVIYLILHFPWPVTARDIIFRMDKSADPANGSIKYSLTALPDRLPRVMGMVRVPYIKSTWIFKSLSLNQTQVFFQQHMDPGGFIPAFLVNELAVDTPYNSLYNLRALITDGKH